MKSLSEDNVVRDKSLKFAIRIVNLCKFLRDNKSEFVLSKQLLRSGTSIGANIEETIGSQSERDFLSKISIAYKEALETRFWIKLLSETGYLTEEQAKSIMLDIDDLCKILGKIQKTMNSKTDNCKL